MTYYTNATSRADESEPFELEIPFPEALRLIAEALEAGELHTFEARQLEAWVKSP